MKKTTTMKMKMLLPLLLLLAAVSSASAGDINVINATPPDGTLVKVGRTVRLSCRTDASWFFCVWKSPNGGKQCAINEERPTSVCSGDERIRDDKEEEEERKGGGRSRQRGIIEPD